MSKIIIYGDGACSGNPGPGGWAFLLADLKNSVVLERSGFEPKTTNNRMELSALLFALETLAEKYPRELEVEFYWDSAYVVKGFNEWLFGWSKKDFVKSDGSAVMNVDLWQKVWALKQALPQFKMTQIPGHSGLAGNERVDALSVAQSLKSPIEEYHGPLTAYQISQSELLEPLAATNGVAKDPSKKYPAYLSYLDGSLLRHLSWDECKARVSGKSAKYKKVKNAVEENQTLKTWKLL